MATKDLLGLNVESGDDNFDNLTFIWLCDTPTDDEDLVKSYISNINKRFHKFEDILSCEGFIEKSLGKIPFILIVTYEVPEEFIRRIQYLPHTLTIYILISISNERRTRDDTRKWKDLMQLPKVQWVTYFYH